uniref:CAK associated cyclinH homolog n=1 Tax=Solanum tuberosum TaxID=4113 RepID=M1AK87_SOLTU
MPLILWQVLNLVITACLEWFIFLILLTSSPKSSFGFNIVLLLPELLAFEQVGKLLTPTSKDVKHVDRKLKSCLDPGSHDKCVQSTLI